MHLLGLWWLDVIAHECSNDPLLYDVGSQTETPGSDLLVLKRTTVSKEMHGQCVHKMSRDGLLLFAWCVLRHDCPYVKQYSAIRISV